MRPYKVTIYKAADGWRFRIQAGNHRTVAASEQAHRLRWYARRKAEKAAQAFTRNYVVVYE